MLNNDCHYAECHVLFIVMLSVIMQKWPSPSFSGWRGRGPLLRPLCLRRSQDRPSPVYLAKVGSKFVNLFFNEYHVSVFSNANLGLNPGFFYLFQMLQHLPPDLLGRTLSQNRKWQKLRILSSGRRTVSRGQCYKTFYGRKLQLFIIR